MCVVGAFRDVRRMERGTCSMFETGNGGVLEFDFRVTRDGVVHARQKNGNSNFDMAATAMGGCD